MYGVARRVRYDRKDNDEDIRRSRRKRNEYRLERVRTLLDVRLPAKICTVFGKVVNVGVSKLLGDARRPGGCDGSGDSSGVHRSRSRKGEGGGGGDGCIIGGGSGSGGSGGGGGSGSASRGDGGESISASDGGDVDSDGSGRAGGHQDRVRRTFRIIRRKAEKGLAGAAVHSRA